MHKNVKITRIHFRVGQLVVDNICGIVWDFIILLRANQMLGNLAHTLIIFHRDIRW